LSFRINPQYIDGVMAMSILRPPGLGPLIGHTTDQSCRLWIQARDAEESSGKFASSRRTVGVIGQLSEDRTQVVGCWYFRLHREFDRTGTFVLGHDVMLGKYEGDDVPAEEKERPTPLQPDTRYTVRMATLSIDDPMPDA
jgi:alkaline phosphatase D